MLDEDLQAFLHATIRSVWALELLLLLRGGRERGWSEEDLVRELRASRTSVSQATAKFETAGLIAREQNGLVRYAAPSVLDELCTRLESAYRERPVSVIQAIMAAPDERLRTFADAFRLKPQEKPQTRKDED